MSLAEKPIILHQGVYKPQASVAEAVFMITGMTIGAGILGIPYVVAKVGLWTGIAYILVLGVIMLYLNLMTGEVAVRTKQSLQLPGLAGHYLGNWARHFLSVVMVLGGTGALLAYTVGEGNVLAAMFGGEPLMWGTIFWALASIVVWRGLSALKNVDRILSFLVIAIIAGLSFWLFGHWDSAAVPQFNAAEIFLPYGVILFALNATPAIAEAHALLPGSQRHFKKALILGTLIPIGVYVLFALAVVGAMGADTTELATLGLGQKFGPGVFWFSNLFAALSMGTGYLGLGIAIKQNLVWDNKVNPFLATLIVILIPICLFFAGISNFVAILDIVGALMVGSSSVIMALVYVRARKVGDLPAGRYGLRYSWLAVAVILAVFTIFTVFSIMKLFN